MDTPIDRFRSFLPLEELRTVREQKEVAEVLAQAAGASQAVYPIGGGTHLSAGGRPTRPGVGLVLTEVNRLVDYPHRDLTVTVEAGMTVRQLQEILARENQWLPVSTADPERTTIGGLLSTAWPGPRDACYGSVGEFLLGCRAVDGRGQMFTCGAKVVKNAAGYNLHRLLAGSYGSLAVITEVTLMVRPRPEASALYAVALPTWEKADEALRTLGPRAVEAAAAQLLAGRYWADVNEVLRSVAATPPVGWLVLALEGSQPHVDGLAAEVLQPLATAGLAPVAITAEEHKQELWRLIEGFSGENPPGRPQEAAGSDEGWLLHLGHLLPEFIAKGIGELLSHPAAVAAQVHAGSGAVWVWTHCKQSDWQQVTNELRSRFCAGFRPTVIVRRPPGCDIPPGKLWNAEPVSGHEKFGLPGTYEIMRRIKAEFDPHGVLNPGRLAWE